jgi:hypothetical protein
MVLRQLAVLLGFWAFNALALAPLLASAAIRRLLRCGPVGRPSGDYFLGTAALTLAQVAALVGTVVAAGGVSTGESGPAAFLVLLAPPLGVVALGAVFLGGVLPARAEWDPSAEGVDGRLVLAGGVVWYALAAGVAAVVVAFLAFLFGYPG